jgi:hypothetical protein
MRRVTLRQLGLGFAGSNRGSSSSSHVLLDFFLDLLVILVTRPLAILTHGLEKRTFDADIP